MSDIREPKINIIRWAVIEPPVAATRSVIVPAAGVSPVVQGDFAKVPVRGVCGGCGTILTEGVTTSQVRQLVIRCPMCGSHNEALDS